jgi:hypothetical protein
MIGRKGTHDDVGGGVGVVLDDDDVGGGSEVVVVGEVPVVGGLVWVVCDVSPLPDPSPALDPPARRNNSSSSYNEHQKKTKTRFVSRMLI